MAAKPLTKAEKKWLADVQAVLDKCPSKRIGFYTIGDAQITVIDQPATDEYEENNKIPDTWDYCTTVNYAKTKLDSLSFPNCVHSTAG